jgi:DNA-binding LytR/AlgR family response regulator
VESIRPWFGSTLKVTLTGNLEVELSRRQTQLFRHRFCL